jgi:hypothetical protein
MIAVDQLCQRLGVDIAVKEIRIRAWDAAVLAKPGRQDGGQLDNALFEIDSYIYAVGDGKIRPLGRTVTVGEAVEAPPYLRYFIELLVYYNERKGTWAYIKGYIYRPPG